MPLPMETRREMLWINIFVIAFMVVAMATACTTTKYVDLKNIAGEPVKMEIKTKQFSNEIVSATVEGNKAGVSGPDKMIKKIPRNLEIIDMQPGALVIQSLQCVYCVNYRGSWIYYPPNCTTCPPN